MGNPSGKKGGIVAAENGKFRIYGKVVVRETGRGVANLIVEALDKDFFFDDRLGSVITGSDGAFEIIYDSEDFRELFFDLKPDIYLRVRKADGTLILTTEDKVRYNAGKTEVFYIPVPKSVIEEDEVEKELFDSYSIKGAVDPKVVEKIANKIPLKAYAIRDRRVVGTSKIEKDGSFNIEYRYRVSGKQRLPFGVDIIIGPDLPSDQILKTKFERKFLSSKGFVQKKETWYYEIDDSIKPSERWWHEFDRLQFFFNCEFTYTGFVYTCSPLNIPPGGQAGCVDQEVLSCNSSDVEAFVRLSRGSYIIAEDIEIDITGKFKKTITWHSLFCFHLPVPVTVEVYQKSDSGEHTLYTGDHTFSDNIAQDIFIDRDKTEIICTPPDPTPSTGSFFGFERVGNIPVEAIYQAGEITGEFGLGTPVPDEFVGYINSVDKPGVVLGSADLKLKDFAFFSTLHFYGNIGEDFGKAYSGGVDMSDVSIKYFRIKYSYENPETAETIGDTYISVPFCNTRKTATGTTCESMNVTTHPVTGDPLSTPTYIYANPYETDANKNWKYRGLMLVLNTALLPRKYGRYTFTLEPLDKDMNPVTTVADPSDLVLTLLIDNDSAALSGGINAILRQSGISWISTSACEVVDLTATPAGNSNNIKVQYSLHHDHGNLRDYQLSAKYGKSKSVSFALTGNTYSRSGTTPYWNDVNDEAVKSHIWQKCAYEFRLEARRRVTNGFSTKYWEGFTYHVMIDSNNPYIP